MSRPLAARGIRAVLLDIEGTTTPMAFVHGRLFTYARAHVDRYLVDHWNERPLREIAGELRAEHEADRAEAPSWRDDSADTERASLSAYVGWLMDRDRKSPGLKKLQGLIWEDGYRAGELRGEVWDDVPAAMRRWHAAGLAVAIYSSGSELAQRRLFESTRHGDLTPFISAFFDTGIGAKLKPESYRRITAALGRPPQDLCFVSDVAAELRAAREAGLTVVLSARPGNPPQPDAGEFERVTDFSGL